MLLPAAPPHRAAVSWWAAAAGAFDPASGARAAGRYAPQPWGTELEASVRGIPPGTACQIRAITASGATVMTSPPGHALYGSPGQDEQTGK